MFGNRIRKLALKMITGVDTIKLTIYHKMTIDLTDKYPDKEHDFCGRLAAAAVNEIYGCHNQDTKNTFQENKKIIETELTDLVTKNPDLKQPITDSLRVLYRLTKC
jgi:hypothetical protein